MAFKASHERYLIEYDKLYIWKILTHYRANYGIMLITVKWFGFTDYFLYLCNVSINFFIFQNNNLFCITIKSSVCENRWFWEVTSELPLFLFMYYAVGLAIMLFICARNDYLLEYDKLYH